MDPALKLLVFAVAFLIALPFAHRRMRDAEDPEWESRWRELSRAERKRIAGAARRGEIFLEPEEAYLAAGSARNQLALGISRATPLRWALAVIVLLAGVAQGSLPMIGFAFLFVAFLAWLAHRDREARRNLARAADPSRRI